MSTVKSHCRACGKPIYAYQSNKECGMCSRKRRDAVHSKTDRPVKPKPISRTVLDLLPANSSEIAIKRGSHRKKRINC